MGFDLPLFNISGASNCQGLSQSPDFGGKSWFPKIFLWLKREKGRILTRHGVQYMVVGNYFNIVHVSVM